MVCEGTQVSKGQVTQYFKGHGEKFGFVLSRMGKHSSFFRQRSDVNCFMH